MRAEPGPDADAEPGEAHVRTPCDAPRAACGRDDLERLLDLGARLSAGLDVGPILEDTLAAAVALVAVPAGGVWLTRDDGAGLELGASLGLGDVELAALRRVAAGHGVIGACLERRAPVVVEAGALDHSVHAVPLLDRAGHVLGVLAVHGLAPGSAHGRPAALLDRCARVAAGPLAGALTHRRAAAELADARAQVGALRLTAERLALAQRAARVCTWDWHLPSGAIVWSEAIHGLLGLRPGDPTPNVGEWLARIHPDDLAEAVRRSDAAIHAVGEFEAEFRVRRDDGTYCWIAARGGVLRDASGAATRFIGANYDISDRRSAEAASRASEARYRALFDSMDQGYCVIDVMFEGDRPVDYRFLEVNPAFEKHTGLHGVAGKRMRELAPDHEEHWFTTYGRVARTGEPERFVQEATALDRWFDVYAFRLDPGHKVAVLFTDITARQRSERERERLVARLRDDDRRKDDFIALLAHELRNPLAPVRTGLQYIRLAGRGDEAVARTAAMMDRQLSHLVRLIDDLMDVSRLGRNKLELRRARVDLADVIGSAVEAVRPLIDDAGHDLQVELPDARLELDADLTRLAQVFSNLLGNSARYTPGGGRIRLTAGAQRGQAVVTVRDDGIGIPAGALSSIFDMFSQIDRSVERSTGGLGLGLALVKALVEMHGGTVAAASEGEGRGSTFTVRLPLAAPAARERRAEPVFAAPAPRRRVLVVDDNRDGAASLAMLLELLGHEVRAAHDGVEGVEVAEQYRPDIILMDVGMPRLSGLDAARQLRERPWARDVTIIALTGWGQEADRARSRAAGCDGHLVKPVALPELERILGARRPSDAPVS